MRISKDTSLRRLCIKNARFQIPKSCSDQMISKNIIKLKDNFTNLILYMTLNNIFTHKNITILTKEVTMTTIASNSNERAFAQLNMELMKVRFNRFKSFYFSAWKS
jgi:hypothetical protein